ncbi:MAG TPA: homoserine kinase [Gemmatimonadales bacterium]|nr:homoserine kinase [Gemmatimonadales bacterium]
MTTPLARVRAFAPGSVGNVGPGLDILGLAVTGPGDAVVAERTNESGVTIRWPGHPDLPVEPGRNSAGLAAREVLLRAGAASLGVALTIEKGLPLAGGQGGSAASAVAAAVAVNALLGDPLDRRTLLEACLAAEERVAGRHGDNVAPSLFGGMILIRDLDALDLVPIPVPDELRVVLAHPDQRLPTAEGRARLPMEVPRAVALHQAAQVAAMVAALAAGDYALLGRALDDRIAEPARAPLLPGFREAKAAALAAGALGASISGSGPTAFALAVGDERARAVAAAMTEAYREAGVPCSARVAQVDRRGARVEG